MWRNPLHAWLSRVPDQVFCPHAVLRKGQFVPLLRTAFPSLASVVPLHIGFTVCVFFTGTINSCAGFCLQPLVTPREQKCESESDIYWDPSLSPELRWDQKPGWSRLGCRKKADTGERDRPWWSTKQKVLTEFTSSCITHRFCNNGTILGGKNPIHDKTLSNNSEACLVTKSTLKPGCWLFLWWSGWI